MAGTEPACSAAEKTASDPSGIDADKGADSSHRAFSSGARIIESGVGLKVKKTQQNEATRHDGCADASDGHHRRGSGDRDGGPWPLM